MIAKIGDLLKKAGNKSQETLSLLAFICQQDSSWIIAHPEYELTAEEKKIFQKKQSRLKSGWPLAYLLGWKNFYNQSFQVSPAVLIPRSESELIVETALDYAPKYKNKFFLDLGTGSGALIIAIAAEIKKRYPKIYKNSQFLASDISSAALNIAFKNSENNKLKKKINFRRGHLLLPWRNYFKNSKLPIFIAANLPYLKPEEQKKEDSIAHEPRLALIGGKDGLDFYRSLLKQIKQILPERRLQLMMEINPAQARILIKEAKKYFETSAIKKISDLSGRTRFILIDRK